MRGEAQPVGSAGFGSTSVFEEPADQRVAAEKTALELLEGTRSSALWKRLRDLQSHILGREVPLLARPHQEDAESPVGSLIGTIDLLYRDPETSEVVVVDFKSDRVTGEEALRLRTAHYAPQGRVYCEAVGDALGLEGPVRFELWFLAMGRSVATRFALPAPKASTAQNVRGESSSLG